MATGPRYRIGDVAIRPPTAQASLPAIDRAKLGLAPGDPADASAILEAQDKLITELRKEGYALASIKRDVVVNHATREATVTFVAETGPLARMGPVRFSGTDKVDTVWLQRRVPFKEGEPYDPTKVEALRGRLTSLGVFNAVRIKPAATLDASGELPFDVELTDRPSRSIGFGVAYETQLGFSVAGFWTHRNLFGQAESLRLTAEITHIGQGYAILDTGFAFRADFRKPDWWLGGQDARLEAAGLREVLDAYTRNAVTAYAGFDRTFSPRWQARLGLAGELSRITRNGITMDYPLVGLPLSILYNHANSDLNPTDGYRVDLDVTPWVYSRDFFTVMRLTGRHYFDFSDEAAACWQLARRSAPSPRSASAASRPTSCSMPAAAVRCADSSTRPRARATPSTIRWAAPASSRRASSSANASASRGAPWPSSMPAAPTPISCPTSRSSRRASAPASALATTPTSGRCGSMSAFRSIGARAIRRSASMSAWGRPSDTRARFLAIGAAGLIGLVAILFAALQTPPGQRAVAGLVSRMASGPDGGLGVSGLSGFFPTDLHVARISYSDREGPWLTVENARLRWSFTSLLGGRLRIEMISADRVAVLRPPLPGKESQRMRAAEACGCRSGSTSMRSRSAIFTWRRHWPVSICTGSSAATPFCRPISRRAG